MRKFILAGLICLSLLVSLPGEMQVYAGSGETSATTEVVYRSTKKTEINRGTGTAKTGDTVEMGSWLMTLSGSALILFLLLWLRQREEEEQSNMV